MATRKKKDNTPAYLRYLDAVAPLEDSDAPEGEEYDPYGLGITGREQPRPVAPVDEPAPVLPMTTEQAPTDSIGLLERAQNYLFTDGPGNPLSDTALGQYARGNVQSALANRQISSITAEQAGVGLVESSVAGELISGPLSIMARMRAMSDDMGITSGGTTFSEREAESATERLARARLESEAGQALSQGSEAAIGGRMSPAAVGARAVSSVITQPEMLLPVVGGIAGTLAGGPAGSAAGAALGSIPQANLAFDSAFTEASELGASQQEAEDYAYVMTAAEFGIDTIGGLTGGLVTAGAKRLGIGQIGKAAARDALVSRIRSRGARTAGAALVEGASEGLTELLTESIRNVGEDDFFSNPDVVDRFKMENAELAANRLERVLDATAAGVLGGAAIGGTAGSMAYAAEQGERQFKISEAIMRGREGEQASSTPAPAPVAPEPAPVPATRGEPEQTDMFDTPDGLPTPEEYQTRRLKDQEMEAGFAVRERQLRREREDAEYRESYPRLVRNAERRVGEAQQNVEIFQDRIDAGDVSQQNLNRMTEALREQRVAEEAAQQLESNPPAEVVAPAPRAEPSPTPEPAQGELDVTSAQEIGPVQARRKRLAEQKAREEKNKTTQERRAETRRRNELRDAAILDNPEATDFEIESIVDRNLREATATPVVEPETVPSEPVVSEQPADPAPAAAPTIPDGEITDAGIKGLADQLGLNQDAERPASARPRALKADFAPKAEAIARALVSKNDQGTTDVQNLILQGKLVVASDQQDIGRADNGAEAEYDPRTGKMYLYADRIDPDNVVEVMGAALHESVHGGQFNERGDRPSMMRALMGNDGFDRAETLIRQAADSGNRVAQNAVRRAEAARPGTTQLEVVPYFVTEATNARGQGLGRLRGVFNDMESSARAFMRDTLGVDLPVNLAELEAAGQRAAGELVQTDTAAADADPLDMIAGRRSPRFEQAQREGMVFTDRDGQEKFITSDVDSRLRANTELAENLLDGVVLQVSDLVDNPTINDSYPELRDTPVMVEPTLPTGAAWVTNEEGESQMWLSPSAVQDISGPPGPSTSRAKSELHSILLHELQHGIQGVEGFARGGSPAQFRTPADNRLISEHRNNTIRHNLATSMVREDLDAIIDDPDLRGDIQEIYTEYQQGDLSPVEFAQNVSGAMRRSRTPSREALNFRTELTDTMRAYADTQERMEEMQDRTYQQYNDLHGEAEARFVEENRTVPEDELPRRPSYPPTTVDMAPLSQAAEARREAPPRRLPPMLTGLLDSAVGTGRVSREIMEYAVSSPARARMEAEQSMARYDMNIKELATERGVDPKVLNDQLVAELNELDRNGNSFEENRAAFAEAVRPYGRAGQDMLDLRDQIDSLTMDIVRQRAETAAVNPLTPAEKETYQTLVNNMGRYVHRSYAVNAGPVGKKFAKKMWADYKSGDNVENRQTVANAVEYIVDNNLYIPDATEIAETPTDTLRNLVEVWGLGRPDAMTPDEMRNTLLEMRDDINGDTNRMQEMAENIANELLGLSKDITSPITSYYRGGRRNDGILKERTGVPTPIRELMGEIVHPAGRLMVTAAKQAEFVARNRALIEMRNASLTDPQLASHIQPPSAGATPATQGMTPLQGETWGVLEGHYVSPNMRAYLSDVTQQLATFEQAVAMAGANPGILTESGLRGGLGIWGNIAGTSKALQIIGNPINFAYNFVGAPRMLLSNGNISPASWGRALRSSAELISNAHDPRSASEEAKRLNSVGVTDSAFIGELKNVQFKRMGEIIREMASDEPGTVGKVWAAMKREGVTLSETYAMMDVWSKIANFYDQVDVLSRYNDAAGTGWTPEQIDRRAADNVNRTNITYKRAAPAVKALERSGVTQFGTYFYEVFRAELSNVKQGMLELKMANEAPNSEAANIMRAMAAKRVGGQLLSWGLTAAAAQGMSQMVFGDDEEERKALRSLLPDYLRDQDFLPVGRDENGDIVLMNMARIDPMGPMTDVMRSMMHEDSSPELIGKKIFDLYVAPRVGTQLAGFGLSIVNPNDRPTRTPLVQQVAPEAYSNFILQPVNALTPFSDNQTRGLVNVAEAFLPGIATSWRGSNIRAEAGTSTVENDTGRAVQRGASTAAVPLQYMGMTMYKLDANRAARSLGFEYKDEMTGLRRNIKSMFEDNPDTLSEDQLLGRLADFRERESELNQDIGRVYRGMTSLGFSQREARAAMKDNGLPKEVVSQLGRGGINSRLVSKASIDGFAQQESVGKSREEKAEIKQKWANVWTRLNGANRELNRRQTEDTN